MAAKFIIEKPCGKDWEKMIPEAKGRFCECCTKCVFDFTDKSVEEIMAVFQAQPGRVCGRFRREQVETPQPKRGRWARAAAMLLMVLTLGACNPNRGYEHKMGEMIALPHPDIVTGDTLVQIDSMDMERYHAPDEGR